MTTYQPQGYHLVSEIWNQQVFSPPLKNAKTTLQEFCQEQQFDNPIYKLVKITGPDHALIFKVKVSIRPSKNKLGYENVFNEYAFQGTNVYTIGKGRPKKIVEMSPAEEMCRVIGLNFAALE